MRKFRKKLNRIQKHQKIHLIKGRKILPIYPLNNNFFEQFLDNFWAFFQILFRKWYFSKSWESSNWLKKSTNLFHTKKKITYSTYLSNQFVDNFVALLIIVQNKTSFDFFNMVDFFSDSYCILNTEILLNPNFRFVI